MEPTFGIKVEGLGMTGLSWRGNMIQGLYFPGYGPEDANPDIGEKAITETAGDWSIRPGRITCDIGTHWWDCRGRCKIHL